MIFIIPIKELIVIIHRILIGLIRITVFIIRSGIKKNDYNYKGILLF